MSEYTKEQIADAVQFARERQAKIICLPNNCTDEDAERLTAPAQKEHPLHKLKVYRIQETHGVGCTRPCGDEMYTAQDVVSKKAGFQVLSR